MSPLPRPDYASLRRYEVDREPVELDLSDNTNLWGAHPDALAVVRAARVEQVCGYPTPYADELREAVADRFGVDADCVTTGAGSDDVLDSAFRAVYAPGASISYASPTFSMVEPFARLNTLIPRPAAWSDALRDPAALLEDGPSLVYVCRPNNPTGGQAPREWLDRLLDLRGDDGPLVVVDEAYADFAGETLLAAAAEVPRLLVTRTASKAYGLAGLRCGFGVARPDVTIEIEKSRGPYKVSGLASSATAAAVRDATGWIDAIARECATNRTRLSAELERRAHRPLPSSANFVLFAAPSGDARADAVSIRARGIGVRPFDAIPDLGGALRVTVGPWPTMERFLAVLDEVFGAKVPLDAASSAASPASSGRVRTGGGS